MEEQVVYEDKLTLHDQLWILHVDRFSTTLMNGASIILMTPDGMMIEYALWFIFLVLNNEVEYEALIVGLKRTKELGAPKLKVLSDS